jgi:hypothetical protein
MNRARPVVLTFPPVAALSDAIADACVVGQLGHPGGSLPPCEWKTCMTFDVPHMIATTVIVLGLSRVLNHSSDMQGLSRGRRMPATFMALCVPTLILNTIWPMDRGPT